jgi:hypothetical protein
MPSPFPGMDPFLEMEEWGDFHHTLMVELKHQLVPQLIPKYIAVVERRVYLEHVFDELSVFQPDLRVTKSGANAEETAAKQQAQTASVSTIEPQFYIAPLPQEHHEPFLEIRDVEGNEVVTVVELVSPTNKARNADGHEIYNEKREQLLLSRVNLVEIDLLRSGVRPATTRPLPESVDYCAMVHRGSRRARIEVYQWRLPQPMPPIPVPLAKGDADARIDLQQALSSVYDASGYRFYLKYHRPLKPPPRPEDVSFISETLAKLKTKTPS